MEITKEEKNALIAYSGYEHSAINSIIHFDPEVIDIHSEYHSLDFSEEKIKNIVNKIKNIYSAMYKYSREKLNDKKNGLYRGTNSTEIKKVLENPQISQLLSTSYSMDIANNFAATYTEYAGSPTVLNISSEGVPYYYMPNIYSGENIDRSDEQEVLFAPFSKVKKIEKNRSTSYSGKKLDVYSIEIEGFDRDNVRNIDEIDEEEVFKNYSSLENLKEEYSSLKFKIKQLDYALENKMATEEEYKEDIEPLKQRLDEVKAEIIEKSSEMEEYLKSSFIEIEKNIEKQIIEEKEEEIRNKPKVCMQNIQNTKASINSRIKTSIETINSIRMKLNIEEVQKLEELGIDISDINEDKQRTILNNLDNIEERLNEILQEVDKIEVTEEMQPTDLEKCLNKLNFSEEYMANINHLINMLSSQKIPQIVDKYEKQISRKVHDKISNELYRAQINDLEVRIKNNKNISKNPLLIFSKKRKCSKLLDNYLCETMQMLKQKGILKDIDGISSANEYLSINPNCTEIRSILDKVSLLPTNLTKSNSNNKYSFIDIPDIPKSKEEYKKFEYMMVGYEDKKLLQEKNVQQKNEYKDSLCAKTQDTDISYIFENLKSYLDLSYNNLHTSREIKQKDEKEIEL